MGREGGVLRGVTSGAVIATVSATAGVLEGGDEDIAIRKSVIANSGQTGHCDPRTVLTMHLGSVAASRVKIMASASSSSSAQSAHALVLSMTKRARIICCQLRAEGAHGVSSVGWRAQWFLLCSGATGLASCERMRLGA